MSKKKVYKSTKTKSILIITVFIVLISLMAHRIGYTFNSVDNSAEVTAYGNVEIPANITDRKELIITNLGYTVSYNPDWKIPNWVAYELTKEEVAGVFPRGKHFKPDPKVPSHLTATTSDYKNSGWDRGHMAPAGDMKWSEQAMKESFYLSNICPQNSNLNSGIWKDLEEQVRGLATSKGQVYVVCGPIVSKQPQTIGTNKVVIPAAFYKALLQNVKGEWSAIAFMFPNVSGRKLMATYALSVEELQVITGIDFFPALPDSIESEIERHVDFSKWTINSY